MPYADPAKDRECNRLSAARMRAADPERFRAAQARYRANNTAKKRLSGRTAEANRAALRYGVSGRLSTADVADALSEPCAYCGAPSAQIDHVTPMSRGGVNDTSNIVGCCQSCNMHKHAKTVLEFMGLL